MAQKGGITRRHYLAVTGAGALVAGLGVRSAAALETVRQGYQTNMWGMPTYYLLRSGLLEKHGVKFEEFAVPSGNLTMQQMVARQVDIGTYAGPSFAIGHDKGGLRRHRHDRICRQDRARNGAQGSQHHQGRAAQGPESRQPDGLVDRQHLRRSDRDQGRPEERRLPGSAHERERHGGGDGGQDRRRHVQCRAVQRDRRGRWSCRHDLGIRHLRQAAGVHGGDAGIRARKIRRPWSPI